MSDEDLAGRRRAPRGLLRSSVLSLTCFARDLPLFFRAAPRTPLRVLCIIALDTLHVLRRAQPLPRQRIIELATLLDFQACTNAAWDRKRLCRAEYQALRERLDRAGLGPCVDGYLRQLGALEGRRPSIGGDHQRFDEARTYREAVARLSLATIAAVALRDECRDPECRTRLCESDVETLFPIVMQCQIIDDVLDYSEDVCAGLPSFLTASSSLPHAIEWTAGAARDYGASRALLSARGLFPLRIALNAATVLTRLVVRFAHHRYRNMRRIAR